MKYFSMFSGIGGFEKGIINAGLNWECVGYSEIDKHAEAIYNYNFRESTNYGNARNIIPGNIPDFDLLTGGFPCTDFSIAGKRQGFENARGTLFFEIARILSDKRPKYFLLENVPGLFSHDNGKTFQTILRILAELNYVIQTVRLNSKYFGVPQNRERVFFIGNLAGERRPEIFHFEQRKEQDNEKGHFMKIYETACCLTTRSYSAWNRNYVTQKENVLKKIGSINGKNQQAMRVYDTEGIASALSACGGGYGGKTGLYAIGHTRRTENGKNDIKYHLKNEVQTLNTTTGTTSNQSDFVLQDMEIRRLTEIECERLQGFPDEWTKYGKFGEEIKEISSTQRYKCLGNAVTTNVISYLVKLIDKANNGN